VRRRRRNALTGSGSAGTAAVVLLLAVCSTAAGRTTDASVARGLQRLMSAPGGPIGAIATLYRNGRPTVLRAGRADVTRPGAPRLGDHMRIASIAKAFSGAVALHLVAQGRLGLDDTIGQRLAGMMPPAWSAVTVRQMLNHTGGLPDYTQSAGFREQATKDPRGYVSPMRIIDWVRGVGLNFTPGSRYEYSNTDNIVVGLIAQRISGRSYGQLLSRIVLQPAGLTQTTLPTLRISLPAPFLPGYQVGPGKPPQDVSTFLSPSGAWASGACTSSAACTRT
jgi:D-alanyl-D-alanine carboxypeptidase